MDDRHVPLEELRSSYFNQSKGDVEDLSVLDPILCQDVHFFQYQPAPRILPEMEPSIWQNWIENLSVIGKNLSWLLKLPYPKFWCQVVNNLSLQTCLDSYLKQTPRFQTTSWPDDVLEKHSTVHRLVFMVYMRMATNKESSKCFSTSEFFGELIYENYLYDIPKIMDLCAIYGNKTNGPLLQKALSNVFKCQPNYIEDLKQSVETIMQIFHDIDEKCGLESKLEDGVSDVPQLPQRLSESSPRCGELIDSSLEEFQDIIIYASDTLFTLRRFLVDVYPDACSAFNQKLRYLARFYSTTLNFLKELVLERSVDDLNLRSQLLAHLKVSRSSLLSIVRQIVNECLLMPAFRAEESGDHSRSANLADEYFQVLSEFLGDPRFFKDYLKKLPVLDDVQSLLKALPEIDETRASFILGSLGAQKIPSWHSEVVAQTMDAHVEAPSNGGEGATVPKSEDVEMDSLISTVQDVLPHLEKDYIERCLEYYQRDSERTIHALLEGNLPDDLRSVNTTPTERRTEAVSETQPPDPTSKARLSEPSNSQNSILQNRKNIYDKDEFDIYENSNIDFSRIHKGKKEKMSLEPRPPTAETRQIYAKYYMVSDDEEVSDALGSLAVGECDIYEDEYDDMYDGLGVDANDADDADDLLRRRPFVTPRVFLHQKTKNVSESDDSDTGSEEEPVTPKPDHFIANPADLRAKQEERRRQEKELRSRNQRGKNSQAKEREKSNQSKANFNQDRKKKDANKAKIANHNRKKMASRKTTKGMGPV